MMRRLRGFRLLLRASTSDGLDRWLHDCRSVSYLCHAALCASLEAGHRCCVQRGQRAVEQRADRKADQSAQDAQASHVSPGRSRIAARADDALSFPPASHSLRKTPIRTSTGNETEAESPEHRQPIGICGSSTVPHGHNIADYGHGEVPWRLATERQPDGCMQSR